MEVVKNIAALLGLIISAAAVLTLLTNAGRTLFKKFFKKGNYEIEDSLKNLREEVDEIKEIVENTNARLSPIEEVSKQQCRNIIKNIYYKYCKTRLLPIYERKVLNYTYEIYTKEFNGNSFVTTLYEEMAKWDSDTEDRDSD